MNDILVCYNLCKTVTPEDPKDILNGFRNTEFVHLSSLLMCLNEKMTGWQSEEKTLNIKNEILNIWYL